jgi:hypothetical protein
MVIHSKAFCDRGANGEKDLLNSQGSSRPWEQEA